MSDQLRFLAKRFALSLVSIYVVATILFLLFRLMPGSAATAMIAPGMSAETVDLLMEQYGLNQPLHVQYLEYMEQLLNGNLGISFTHNKPVLSIILDKLPNTLALMLTSIILSFVIGPIVGAYLAWRRNSSIDVIGIGTILVMYSAPVFWTGMLAIMLFSFTLNWLPSGGMRSAAATTDTLAQTFISVDFLRHLILPATVTTLYWLTPSALTMRNNMVSVLTEDFIQMARAEGLPEIHIVYGHAARSALLPVLHRAALAIGLAFGGSVIIETVFSWPGIGRLMWQAVLAQDYPLAQGVFLLLSAIIILMNFVVDVLSVYVDPRVTETEVVE